MTAPSYAALTAVVERVIAAEAAYESVRRTNEATPETSQVWLEQHRARQAFRDAFTPGFVLTLLARLQERTHV